MALPEYAAAWLRQRESGAGLIAELEDRRLATLDDQEALRLADALLAATPQLHRTTSGFCEQQRLFARARR